METFKNAGLDNYFDSAYGFAVFETVKKAAVLIGAGGAKGEVYAKNENGEMKKVGDASMTMISGGWSLGLSIYSEIIFFETKAALDKFTSSGSYEFEGTARAHVTHAGESRERDHQWWPRLTFWIHPSVAKTCVFGAGKFDKDDMVGSSRDDMVSFLSARCDARE